MADASKTPDLYGIIKKWVFDHFGVSGLVGLALIAAAIYVYKNWDKVKSWPGVKFLIERWHRWSIPQADANRFSVMVARLENDTNRENEQLIIEALKEFEGVQVLSLDRTIVLKGPVPEKMENRGHEDARSFLRQSGASVLIWGTVLSGDGGTVLKLCWTHGSEAGRKWERYDSPTLQEQLMLPELFWSDLAEILRLLVASHEAEFRAKEGHYVADQLPPFIARVRRLLEASSGRLGWDADGRGSTCLILADALLLLGDQCGKNEPLIEAVAAYRQALQEYPRERVPLGWAMTHNNLGVALQRIGERESGIASLEEAVASYREALKERTRERVPLDWAMTHNNLGTALWSLGERESGTKYLEEAVAAYREALKERTREGVPLKWATTQHNLGTALWSLGKRESGTKPLEDAVAAYREALKEYTRERVPLKWAMTQNNLGSALKSLGERESGTDRLEEAVAAYKAALEVFEKAQATYYINLTKRNLLRAEALLQERRQ